MKITAELAQEEIEEAVKQYIAKQSFVDPDMDITVDFVGGRGKTAAMVVFNNTLIKEAKPKTTPAPKKEPVIPEEEKSKEEIPPVAEEISEDVVPDDSFDTDGLFGSTEDENDLTEEPTEKAAETDSEDALSDEAANSLFA